MSSIVDRYQVVFVMIICLQNPWKVSTFKLQENYLGLGYVLNDILHRPSGRDYSVHILRSWLKISFLFPRPVKNLDHYFLPYITCLRVACLFLLLFSFHFFLFFLCFFFLTRARECENWWRHSQGTNCQWAESLKYFIVLILYNSFISLSTVSLCHSHYLFPSV